MVCAMNLAAEQPTERVEIAATRRGVIVVLVAAPVLFWLGRHFCHLSTDFIGYHRAAISFLAGRTDLYSTTFAWGSTMQYVYPPLFLLLFFPLGWLSFANAFGVWFAANGLATAVLIVLAYREWRPRRLGQYWLIFVALCAVPVLYALKNGNAHLLVVLLTLAGLLAWSKGRTWVASACLALAGAFKLIPLLLLPFLLVRREWKLALKMVLLSCLLWAAPAAYYGPRLALSLYRSWYNAVPADVTRFESTHQLDSSLTGATRRWLTHIDYSQHRDKDYPEVNVLDLPPAVVRVIASILKGIVLVLTLAVAGLLPRVHPEVEPREHRLEVATISSLFITSQLLLGPYTNFLYLSGWLIVALTLPVVFERWDGSLNRRLLGVALGALIIFALPGRSLHRALEAAGVFTLLNVALWLLSLLGGWKWLRAGKRDC
jgi:uncharacterized membrane protein